MKENNKFNILNSIFFIFLFLFSLDFLGETHILYIILMIFGIVLIFFRNNSIKFSAELFILTICFTSYFLIYNHYNDISVITFVLYWFGPISAYFIGYNIINYNYNINIEKIVIIIAYGFCIHGFLNMLMFDGLTNGSRLVPDFWTGIPLKATLQGTYFTLIVSLLFYGIFMCKYKKTKIIMIISIILAIYASFETGTRTLLVIIAIVFMANYILFAFLNKGSFKKISKLFIKMVMAVSIVFIMFTSNFLGLKDIYEDSQLYKRTNQQSSTTLEEDPRFEMYEGVLIGVLNYPLGGHTIPNLKLIYAHNLWLDTAISVGIIPFSLLIFYSLMTLVTMFNFLKNNLINNNEKILVFSVYLGLTLNFMVEPILEGVPYLFIVMCMINGVTRSKLMYAKKFLDR